MKRLSSEFIFENKYDMPNGKKGTIKVALTIQYSSESYTIYAPQMANSLNTCTIDNKFPAALIQGMYDANQFAIEELSKEK